MTGINPNIETAHQPNEGIFEFGGKEDASGWWDYCISGWLYLRVDPKTLTSDPEILKYLQ